MFQRSDFYIKAVVEFKLINCRWSVQSKSNQKLRNSKVNSKLKRENGNMCEETKVNREANDSAQKFSNYPLCHDLCNYPRSRACE